MKTHSEQFLRRRKFLMVLPLLALPFLTIAFWALGGGEGKKEPLEKKQGLNRELPAANLPGESLDKMSLYNQAARDSLATGQSAQYSGNDSLLREGDFHGDPNETKVNAKLAQLEKALTASENTSYGSRQFGAASDTERLEAMMRSMSSGNGADPEMAQLQQMLEAIMDIQNPARAQEKLRQESQKNKGRVYAVTKPSEQVATDLFGGRLSQPMQAGIVSGRFYDLERPSAYSDTLQQIAVPAEVHETQTVVAGATVKMRLSEAVMVGGVLIPSGTFLSGVCNVSGERLNIEIANIRYGKNLFPVALSVYDLDGIEGIHIPGAISRDAAKEGADRTLQGVQFMSLDPSIGAQAAGAGVEVAKGLFGKKAKLVRVTVKAGHPILLMDMKARQENN